MGFGIFEKDYRMESWLIHCGFVLGFVVGLIKKRRRE